MTDRTAPSPPRLWWVYLLVLFALAALGAGTGAALSAVRDTGALIAVDECANRAGLSVSGSWSLPAGSVIADRCARAYGAEVATAMVAGAAALPTAALALMLVGGIAVRTRLPRRHNGNPAVASAVARFDHWCAELALVGRHRPRIRFLPAAIRPRPAFTTALPFTRPDIVLPESYAYADRRDFDLVVLHELGHVRAGDVSWAASVWWSGWLPIPALLAVIVPAVTAPDWLATWRIAILTSVVLCGAILVLRAALLRRRELAADRFASAVLDDPAVLADFFGGAVNEPVRHRWWIGFARSVRLSLAVHPRASARARAPDAPAWEGGGVVTATAGVVAMICWQTVVTSLTNWRAVAGPHPGVPSAAALGLAATVWAVVVVPDWRRRAFLAQRAGQAVRWRGPFAGAVAGLLAGYCLPVPGLPWLVSTWPIGSLPVLLAVLGLMIIAVAVLLTGLVGVTVGSSGGRAVVAGLTTVMAVAIALYVGWQTTSELVYGGANGFPAVLLRTLNNAGGIGTPTAWLVPLVLGAVLVTAVAGGGVRLPRRTAASVGVGLLFGSAFAVLPWLTRHPPMSPDTAWLITAQRYWICGLAGLTVFAALVIERRGRPDRLPTAVGVGTLTTAAVTLIADAVIAVAGRPQSRLGDQLATTLWLLLLTLMATLPWLPAAVREVARRWSARTRPIPWHVTRFASAGVGLVITALSLILLAGSLSSVTVGPHDLTLGQDFLRRLQSTASADPAGTSNPTSSSGADPGRPLDTTQATAVVTTAAAARPAGSTPKPNSDNNNLSITPLGCARAVSADNAIDDRPHTARVERTYTIPGPKDLIAPTLTIELVSLRDNGSLDSVIQGVVTACPTFRVAVPWADGGRWTGQTTGDTTGGRYQQRVIATGSAHGVVVGSVSDWTGAQVGHNYLSVDCSYQYTGDLPPPEVEQYVQLTLSVVFTIARIALTES